MAGHQIFVYCIWTKLNLFFCDLLYVFLSLVEMVRQRRCFKKSQNLENFWYLCRRGLFQSRQIPTEGTRKVRKGSQNAVTWKKMHFQVCIFLYQSVFQMDKDSHSDFDSTDQPFKVLSKIGNHLRCHFQNKAVFLRFLQ